MSSCAVRYLHVVSMLKAKLWPRVVLTYCSCYNFKHAILNFAFIAAFMLLLVGLEELTLKATISSDYSMQVN